MNIAEIELELRDLVSQPFDPEEFIYRFLEIYKAPETSIKKLRNGADNKADRPGDILWKAKLYFSLANDGKTEDRLDALLESKLNAKHKPGVLFTTDGNSFSAYDAKAREYRHGEFCELNNSFDFFFPVAGIAKYQAIEENKADVQAAGMLARLHDAILAENADWASDEMRHQLNLFMTRILFCMFAEDTGIFPANIFTKLVTEFGDQSERNIPDVLDNIFTVMNTPEGRRSELPEWAAKFPYVNGGLFEEKIEIPRFSKKATRALKEAARLDWKEINPDIFGSMIQAVVHTDMRGDLGMHYTSVPNIMKVLHPLFLMEMEENFIRALGHVQEKALLQKLLMRISRTRVFDPACGSGNFLIIAYRELRKLEMRIYQRQDELNQGQIERRFDSVVKLSNFFGVELADFAAETAKLSLWIVEYQMNKQFKEIFGDAPPALPLNTGGNIFHGNALRISWEEICPPRKECYTYIVGNPPYLGRADQTAAQKDDLKLVFSPKAKSYKNLDYVSAWYLKAASYSELTTVSAAFVATNSICQGEQVALLWPLIYSSGLEIGFAHTSFKWRNNAKKNAAVTCVIVGVRTPSVGKKLLFHGEHSRIVNSISPYLIEGDATIVLKRSKPLCFQYEMTFGSMANDGGYLILSDEEKDGLIEADNRAGKYIRRIYGSQEFAKGIKRYCLWVEDDQVDGALEIPAIKSRIEKVAQKRSDSTRKETVALADVPHRFGEVRHQNRDAILVPKNTSGARNYVTAGVLDSSSIITDLAFAIYGAPMWVFAIISSQLHYVWGATVGGQFKTDPRYSNTLVYNTFPIPDLTDDQKQRLEEHAWDIISSREQFPGKTIAWLYDPKTMPLELESAHGALNNTLEKIYIGRPFKNDTERLEYLFQLYSKLTAA